MLLLFIFIWIGCALLSAGWQVAYFQRKYPLVAKAEYKRDLRVWLCMGMVFGPVSTLATLATSDFAYYGWTLFPPKE